MKLLPYPFSEAPPTPTVMCLGIVAPFGLFLDHSLGVHLQFLITLHHFIQLKYSLLFLFILDLLFSTIFDDNSAGINSKHHILYIVPVLELFAWIGTFDKGPFSVAQLAYLVVTPEHEGAEVIIGYAMSPPARNVIDHQRCLGLVE